jgi:mono/diheme cytochrome c family protein
MKQISYALCSTVVLFVIATGCKPTVSTVEFEPNMLFAHTMEVESGLPMKQALNETQDALHELFGTPNDPKLPKVIAENPDYAKLVSLEKIVAVSPNETGAGLYIKHCGTCHGPVGNGRGLTAALLDPYPRDYRSGKFKFKSTPRGIKPLRDDLFYSIRHGISGTSMRPIPELKDDEVDALVDYVIFLSMRGELERNLLRAAGDVVFEDGEHLFDVTLKTTKPEAFEEQFKMVEDSLLEIADSWLAAVDQVKTIPPPPAEIPVPATVQEVMAANQATEDSPLKQSINRGREIFLSETGACAKCHGKTGLGDGQTEDYDEWTKEWTVRIGIDPKDEAAQIPFIARGALPAKRSLPRDFRLGLYRGGDRPEMIYRRIAEGIDATPMPAASVPPTDVWHLVNFVRSLAVPPTELEQ